MSLTKMQTILNEQAQQLGFDELMLIIKAENVSAICQRCPCYPMNCPYAWAKGTINKICPALREEMEANNEP